MSKIDFSALIAMAVLGIASLPLAALYAAVVGVLWLCGVTPGPWVVWTGLGFGGVWISFAVWLFHIVEA